MKRVRTLFLAFMAVGLLSAASWLQIEAPVASLAVTQPADAAAADDAAPAATAEEAGTGQHEKITLFEPMVSDHYSQVERIALLANVGVALAGLIYAGMLVGQVMRAPQGTPRMQEIAQAIREGANAYLYRQFSVVVVLIGVITVALYFAATYANVPIEIAWGRAIVILRRVDVFGHRRLRRHAAGHDRQPARGGGRPDQLRQAPCNSATAPARSPAC